MIKNKFTPAHLTATMDDLSGNNGIGRYIILPGSDGRAREIANHFDNVTEKTHPRGHNLYLGTIKADNHTIDVATISSGMGCPSTEIIVHELFQLGGRRFLRLGTAGSLQPHIKVGQLINVHAAVRDEDTTLQYAPLSVPALASLEFVSAILLAAEKMDLPELHTGTVHCKSSLYAREFGFGPKANEHQAYLNLIKECGVLASEMECATLFIQSQIYNHQVQLINSSDTVLSGAILTVVSSTPDNYKTSPAVTKSINQGIQLALESIKTMAMQEV